MVCFPVSSGSSIYILNMGVYRDKHRNDYLENSRIILLTSIRYQVPLRFYCNYKSNLYRRYVGLYCIWEIIKILMKSIRLQSKHYLTKHNF